MIRLRVNAARARAFSSTAPASFLRLRGGCIAPPPEQWSHGHGHGSKKKEAGRIASRWSRSTASTPAPVGPPAVVTVTKGPGSVPAENEVSPPKNSSTSTRNTATKPIKPNDRIVEEGILALQSELRAHHRHAAYDAALETAKELLERASTHFGDNHPATASAHNNVGLMNKMLGNYSEAKEAYHKSLRIYGEVVGKDHASYAAALSNLGMLERGRVLESEAEASKEDEGNAGSAANNFIDDDKSELEELREGNSPQSRISAMERMQLNESAIEYFDEAYNIRLSELGPDHPHTVTSRSQLGSAMAAAVIAERRGRIGGLVEAELRRIKIVKDVKDSKEMEAYIPEVVSRAATKSASPSRLTRRRWEAAEEHLRGALAAAVSSPRGESVSPLMFIPVKDGPAEDEFKENQVRRLTTLQTKKGQKLSKKEQKRLAKERLRERRRATRNALQSMRGELSERNIGDSKIAVQGAAGKVTTLTAAAAAQNLAVFLKNFSDWMRLTMAEKGDSQREQIGGESTKLCKTVEEARHLYESALHVRSSILPSHHPEVVATKFSLAELLDSPVVATAAGGVDDNAIDGHRANALREEIMNAFNVEERTEGDPGIAR